MQVRTCFPSENAECETAITAIKHGKKPLFIQYLLQAVNYTIYDSQNKPRFLAQNLRFDVLSQSHTAKPLDFAGETETVRFHGR